MKDWRAFTEAVPWFLKDDATVNVGRPRKGSALSPAAARLFPPLQKLLTSASITKVSVNRARYLLVAWDGASGDRTGWLCLPGTVNPRRNLFKDHRTLLRSFGGIVERFNEPSRRFTEPKGKAKANWLLNLNDALTQREAARDAGFIDDYMWAFEDAGLTLPIEPAEYYSIACEANGNTTLCHRTSGKVLMFAPDHDFDHLKELAGCPRCTLYTINGASTFRDWVNVVALQWLTHTGDA